MNTPTKAELEAWHDGLVESAKMILIKDGYLMPVAFVLARSMEIDPFLRARCREMGSWRPMPIDGSNPTQLNVLSFPLSYDDPDMQLTFITYLAKDPVETGQLLAGLIEMGGSSEKARKHVVDTFLRSRELDGKDLVAAFLRKVCRNLDAVGLVKIDDAWMAKEAALAARASMPESLGDLPSSVEVIMANLEHREGVRGVMLPYFRSTKGTGNVTDFGERRVHDNLDGRFANLMRREP